MSPELPVLYGYWRSSAAYRVRITLSLKKIAYKNVPVYLGGEQRKPEYLSLNPQALVPTWVENSHALTQSLAIIQHLEDTRPVPSIFPNDPWKRARVHAFALAIAADLHPINNLRILTYLEHDLGIDKDGRDRWYRHWIAEGLSACEKLVEPNADYCFGNQPTLADICLVPQIYNANRFNCDLKPYPNLCRIAAAAETLPAFQAAHPAIQPDCPDVKTN